MRHQQPGGQSADAAASGFRGEEQQRRSEIDDGHPENGSSQQQSRVMKLRESGSRNHGADFGESAVVANAARVVGDAEPDAAAGAL